MPDHLHLLVRLRPTVLLSRFAGQVKGATAFRVNQDVHPRFKLRWPEGYGVLSLRQGELVKLGKVSRYLDQQEEHLRKGTLSKLLETSEMEREPWPEGEAGKTPERGLKR